MTDHVADDVLARSEDVGEWEDVAEAIEVRPSGSHVISARIPEELAQRFLDEASRRGLKPSQLAREAFERLLSHDAQVGSVNFTVGYKTRVWGSAKSASYRTETPLVFQADSDWLDAVALVSLGYSQSAESTGTGSAS